MAARTALFQAIREAADTNTLPLFRARPDVENKAPDGAFDPVTEADRACERAIRALIEASFPDDGIIGEEYGTVRPEAAFQWIIDPIDGTRAYVSGVPLWGTLVGLLHNGRPCAGMGYQPYIGEAFVNAGSSAMHLHRGTEKPLSTRPCTELSAATLFTTTPALFGREERPCYDAVEKAARANRYGADWYGYALVASGTTDIVIETGLAVYDILPLVPIIEGAGGLVCNWRGAPLTPEGFTGQVLALGDAALKPALLDALAPAAR
ncbi:MAG: histidinol-phosphatase [Devosiaceae bacterium]|nr:histidinol-phosphatase [Devosiaceae bacterium MH13]